ncbi:MULTISPECIES: lactococcin 972 family bacteriocin [unclassified Leifsonia]|uniref:lactococcin 972 family bacteriocin n=1 Tax=unclassified Leifsonia TaxID=2663824 RepID=UPI0008A7A0A7|nr:MULTISPECIES: lactococcin 972 family bacteriocin [unclassified Leifsonia]SEI15557.1 bacteriocin, lactococcin 972 family [Leifsonia sp. CL154]SFL91630.1 bacteriocin, lactococcin 972 family [Leifsonia sp. CL147]
MLFKKSLFAVALVGLSIVAPVSVASASAASQSVVKMGTTTQNAGGGLWQYGVESTTFSYYHHATKNHTATACNGASFGQTCSQAAAVKNAWARASISKTPQRNTAYWNTL